jgi:glycyl-tRNA synthetase
MLNLYEKNGLIFWTESDIKLRKMFEDYFSTNILKFLQQQNSAFHSIQVEAPILTPKQWVNKNYTAEDMWCIDDYILRPETTMGSYEFVKHLLNSYGDIKWRAPIIVWQHGKSFRREQDQPTKFMRLKEFYQLEFQIVFSEKTMNDYSINLYPEILKMFNSIIGDCRLEESDRLPDYSEQTIDIICNKTDMEICSMSKRKDLEGFKVIEIAIGTDRCIYNFNNK